MTTRGMSRSGGAEQLLIAAVAHRDRRAVPARDATALARSVPVGGREILGIVKDEGGRDVARRTPLGGGVEEPQPLDETPALGWSGGASPQEAVRRDARREAALHGEAHGHPQLAVRIGRVYIGEPFIGEEAAKPEAEAPAVGHEDEMPLARQNDLGGDVCRGDELGEPRRGEAVGRRFGDGDMRAGLGLPERGGFGDGSVRVQGERPTPIVARAQLGARCAAASAPTPPTDRRGDRPGFGAGTPARNRRDHMFRIFSENMAIANRRPDPFAPPADLQE